MCKTAVINEMGSSNVSNTIDTIVALKLPTIAYLIVENKIPKAAVPIGAPLSLNTVQKEFEFNKKRAFNCR